MTTLDQPELRHAPDRAEPRTASRHFLSWVRDGLAGRLDSPDPGSGPLPGRATLTTGVTLNGEAVPGPTLALHGPGDVVGLDPRQIVRVEPAPGTADFEPEHLVAVDLDDPALPWRFTPAGPHPTLGLRPWLVLVVVDLATEGVKLTPAGAGPLPVLTTPATELPDLDRSASWAHAEVTAVDGEDLATLLRTRPERCVSRLLAPRVLTAGHRYLACLVPAFAHGVAAGLGLPPEGEHTAPAWTTGTVTLPVYHSWTFGTGLDGDFPALAGRLRPVRPAPGRRTLSYRDADPELTGALGDDAGLTTVLPALHPAETAPDPQIPETWQQAVRGVLARGDTELTPPIYLAGHTGHGRAWTGTEPPWQTRLNSDPRLRAAAGLGAQVVREHQEDLMAAAWRQAADLDEANRQLSNGRLGRAVSDSLHRRYFAAHSTVDSSGVDGSATVVSRSAAALNRVAAPGTSFRAVGSDTGGTVAGGLDTHPATASTVAPSVQRTLRPTGPLAKAAGATHKQPLGSATVPVATGEMVPAPTVEASEDTGVLDRVAGDNVQFRGITADLVEDAVPWWRGWAQPNPDNRPLVTPGAHAYLADLVTVDQQPTGSPGAITITVHRELDYTGRPRTTGRPFPLPHPDGVPPGLRLFSSRLVRGQDAEPALLLLFRVYDIVGPQQLYVRWVYGLTATGYRAASPLVPVGVPVDAWGDLAVTVQRVPDEHGVSGDEVLVTWYDWVFDEFRMLRMRPGAGPTENRVWTFHVEGMREDGVSFPYCIAMDWIPAPFDGVHRQPRDLLVAMVVTVENQWGPSVWQLRYCVVRDPFTDHSVLSPLRIGGDIEEMAASRHPDDGTGFDCQLAVTVSDLDGDGQLDLLTQFTHYRYTANGAKTWQTQQRVGAELDPVTGTADWTSRQLWFTELPSPGPLRHPTIGDIDENRLTRLSRMGDRFQDAAAAHQARLLLPATEPAPAPTPADYSIDAVASEVSTALDPTVNIPNRVLDRVRVDGEPLPATPSTLDGSSADPLRPLRFEPSFPQPMAEPLRELAPELVFPAEDAVPPDGLALMAGNAELIAAYLAGLNDEFGRELLWRGFPTGGRATWFRRFFDTRGANPAADGDIADIAGWGTAELTDVVTGAADPDTVTLLVRGELVRRFPNVVVRAVRAVVTGDPPRREPLGEAMVPSFTGTLGDDITLFGFPLTAEELRGGPDDPGWFLCFAEPPTESRFTAAGDTTWTQPAATTAAALLALPYRVAIHASDLLEETLA